VSSPRTGLINTSPGKRSGPQGLKPALLSVLNGTAEAVPYPKPFMRPVLLFVARCGVVTATGLDFVLSLLRFDLDFSERAVARGIGGCVTNVVLAAKFLRNLIESLAEFLNLVTNFNHAAAGFLREFFHRGIAAIAHAAIETAVRDEQHVADGIGLLRRFDGIFDLEAAAFIFSIGEQDHRLASNFVAEFVMGSEIHGIIKRSAALAGRGARNRPLRANRAARATESARVDLGCVERMPKSAHGVGEILQQSNVDVEANDKSLVLGAQRALQK